MKPRALGLALGAASLVATAYTWIRSHGDKKGREKVARPFGRAGSQRYTVGRQSWDRDMNWVDEKAG